MDEQFITEALAEFPDSSVLEYVHNDAAAFRVIARKYYPSVDRFLLRQRMLEALEIIVDRLDIVVPIGAARARAVRRILVRENKIDPDPTKIRMEYAGGVIASPVQSLRVSDISSDEGEDG